MTQLKSFLQKYYQQIFALFGLFTVLILTVLAILQSLRFVSGLPGFNFDPFLLGGLVFVGYLFSSAVTNQTRLLERQYILLEKISKESLNKQEVLLGNKKIDKKPVQKK